MKKLVSVLQLELNTFFIILHTHTHTHTHARTHARTKRKQ